MTYSKTDAGRAEIRAKGLPLSRAARNLLLVLDASKPAAEWLRLVVGATAEDLQALREHGLVAPPGGTGAPVHEALPAVPAAASGGSPLLDRAALYAYMSGQATKLLGPFKGYSFALDVERCESLPELQALALQFVERVQKAKGDDAAASVREALGLR
ncbi:hypothetical protein [Roseateles sp. BYS96W]|uniref:Uncharacterized protein n=1 Tax=Pelomonas nitida TaxID=3299027 RepID=A0ABW7GDA6_9BURK